MSFMYMGDHGPATQEEREQRYAEDQCLLSESCWGTFHLEGCPKAKPPIAD